MSVIDKLASSLGRRDEVPNQELARQIAGSKDKKAVAELVALCSSKDKAIQSDCIKVIYEIGGQQPALIAGYAGELTALLDSKNNRMKWGAMTALHSIAALKPVEIFEALPKIITAADSGSVIANDHCVGILLALYAVDGYADDAFALLNERLLSAPNNQWPTYAEKTLPLIRHDHKAAFIQTIQHRLTGLDQETKRKRVEKVLKKLQGK